MGTCLRQHVKRQLDCHWPDDLEVAAPDLASVKHGLADACSGGAAGW